MASPREPRTGREGKGKNREFQDEELYSRAVLIQERKSGRVHHCTVGIRVVVGRVVDTCKIYYPDDAHLSREHCQLLGLVSGAVRVKDTSSYGTFLNGVPVKGAATARPGDVIRAGELEFEVVGILDPRSPKRARSGALTVPQRLAPRYVLVRGIAKGGMGYVYEAYDEQNDRRCAIKVLMGSIATPEMIARFKREAALQASLSEWPGIVSVRGFGRVPDGGELFFEMEYVRGADLGRRIEEGISVHEGLRLMARLARAVHYAHERGVVHRDLKPANVLVTDSGTVRLTDFGLCKHATRDVALSSTGMVTGTPQFMAPEQISDSKRAGPRADVYGLGACLYAVLTGQPPYPGDNLLDVLTKVAVGALTPPRTIDPSIHLDLNDLCMRSMSPFPDKRPESALAFGKEIDAWLKRHAPSSRVRLERPSGRLPKGSGVVRGSAAMKGSSRVKKSSGRAKKGSSRVKKSSGKTTDKASGRTKKKNSSSRVNRASSRISSADLRCIEQSDKGQVG